MNEARENYLKILTRVKEMYGDHNQIHLSDDELYISVSDRYGGQTYITFTEEQVMKLAREADDRFMEHHQSIWPYIGDYDYYKEKGKDVSKEVPETT